jgi:UDP-glucuronate decarboxylase
MKEHKITALVSGGAGFIGFHLCRQLIEEGKNVICLDNFHTGRKSNVTALLAFPQYHFIKHDITKPFFSSEHIDEIYNLACPASPIHYQESPIQTLKTCFIGTLHMLELAYNHDCPILQASTSEVYGDPDTIPQSESYWGHVNPIGIRSCYDEGKRCAESLCIDYHRQHDVKVKIIRIFNTYGPYMAIDDGRVISNFIIQALRNKNITVNGYGSQTRSFQYIDDLIGGIKLMMRTEKSFTGPVNLGNPNERSVLSLAEEILRLTNSKSKITFRPLPEDEPQFRRPDITLAQSKLKWTPKVTLEEGLRKTIKFYQSSLFFHNLK